MNDLKWQFERYKKTTDKLQFDFDKSFRLIMSDKIEYTAKNIDFFRTSKT